MEGDVWGIKFVLIAIETSAGIVRCGLSSVTCQPRAWNVHTPLWLSLSSCESRAYLGLFWESVGLGLQMSHKNPAQVLPRFCTSQTLGYSGRKLVTLPNKSSCSLISHNSAESNFSSNGNLKWLSSPSQPTPGDYACPGSLLRARKSQG